MGLTSDYIKVPDGDEDKSLLERYGYTKEQFIAWVEGKEIGKPQNTPTAQTSPQEKSEQEVNEELDDFLS